MKYITFCHHSNLISLGISEIWLDDSVDGEIHFPAYNIFRSDRNRHGGGIATFVRNSLQVTSLSNISVPASLSPHFESLWLNVKSPTIPYILVFGCCYRPPSASTSSLTVTFNFLEVLLSNYKNVIIAGDFNINHLKSNNKTTATSMRDFITTHSLTQPITLPTRVTPCSSTLLDIFLTTPSVPISSSGRLNICLSDHSPIFLKLCWRKTKSKLFPIRQRSFRKFNLDKFNDDLSRISWSDMDSLESPDEKLTFFQTVFTAILNRHAPWHTKRAKRKGVPWLS